MNTEDAMQQYMDSLSNVPGSLLYRDTINWQPLAPGQPGETLSLDPNQRPVWKNNPRYRTALMAWLSSTARFSKTAFSCNSGSWTATARFRFPASGAGRFICYTGTGFNQPFRLQTTDADRLYCEGYHIGGSPFLRIVSNIVLQPNENYYAFLQYDTATGTPRMIVNGQDVDDTTWGGRIANPGGTGASSNGSQFWGCTSALSLFWQGHLGNLGFHYTKLPVWSDFMDEIGNPLPINTNTWPQWTAQPYTWHESGDLTQNRGTQGAFAQTGTIKIGNADTWNP